MSYLYQSERLEALKRSCEFLCQNKPNFKRLEDMLYDANARHDLDDELNRLEEFLLNKIETVEFTRPWLKGALRAEITGSVFSSIWNAAQGFLITLQITRTSSLTTFKRPVLGLLSLFPLFNDIYRVTWFPSRAIIKQNIFSNLVMTLLNPVKILHALVTFTEHTAYRILEIGLTEQAGTPMPQVVLKGLVGVVATVIRIPLTILQPFSDILPAIVNNLVIQPVKYAKNRVFPPAKRGLDQNASSTSKALGNSGQQSRRFNPTRGRDAPEAPQNQNTAGLKFFSRPIKKEKEEDDSRCFMANTW